MKLWLALVCLALLTFSGLSRAQETPAADGLPVTVEYYYRIRWGGAEEFRRLYAKNHAPLLAEMKKQGFIRSVRMEEPFTHMAGGTRWDLRVTISFRDAKAAINDPEWERLWDEATERLYGDRKTFGAEEARRFGLLEEHWDVIVHEVH